VRFDDFSFALYDDVIRLAGIGIPPQIANFTHHEVNDFAWNVRIAVPLYQQFTTGEYSVGVRFIETIDALRLRNIAAGIMMNYAWTDEQAQGYLVPRLVSRDSSFSEEDLVSDMLGFYGGYMRHTTGLGTTIWQERVKESCGEFSDEAKRRVYERYYEGTTTSNFTFFPRNIPIDFCGLGIDLSLERRVNARTCSQHTRNFPPEFVDIINNAVPQGSARNGSWWNWNNQFEFRFDYIEAPYQAITTGRVDLIIIR